MSIVRAIATSSRAQTDRTAISGDYVNLSQAAALLGVSRMTVWRWVRSGRLPVARLGHRTVRINRGDLDRFLADGGLGRSATYPAQQHNSLDLPVAQPDGSMMQTTTSTHTVQFYESDAFLLDAVAAFLLAGLRAGETDIVVATPEHRVELDKRLRAADLDLTATRAAGRYVTLDADETLAQFMVAGQPDAGRFAAVLGGVIAQAGSEQPVRVFGEMVALLASAGNHPAALRLEELWNLQQQRQKFALFCAYPLRCFGDVADAGALSAVCAAHSDVVPTESYLTLATAGEQVKAIVALQQKAQRLEAEIAERQRVEQQLREEHRLTETLYQISAMITEELDIATVVQTVTDAATNVLGAAFGAFFYNVTNEKGESYQLYTLSGAPREAFAAFPMPRNTAIFGPTFRGESLVRLADVTADPRYGHTAPHYGLPPGHLPVRSYLAVPVISRAGEVLGGLFFGHPEPGVFCERAERIAVGIASHAAIALDKARLYSREKEARDAAQRALHLRDEFLGSISHDLRTPLTSITGLSQLLLRQASRGPTTESERVTKALQQVDASAARMAAMIDELLDLTRLESGRPLSLNRASTDALELVRRVVGQHQRGAGEHRLTLDTDLAALAVCWDSARMARVLSNLLSNAVKYSPDGGAIVVRLSSEQVDGQPWLRLTVEDQGLGIPAADLPHVFERFHRAGNVQGRFKGSGIGLAGSKQIVEQHGGTIVVESRENAGTSVTVCLPCAFTEEDDA
jgi:excisionase family DNA binding protein